MLSRISPIRPGQTRFAGRITCLEIPQDRIQGDIASKKIEELKAAVKAATPDIEDDGIRYHLEVMPCPLGLHQIKCHTATGGTHVLSREVTAEDKLEALPDFIARARELASRTWDNVSLASLIK